MSVDNVSKNNDHNNINEPNEFEEFKKIIDNFYKELRAPYGASFIPSFLWRWRNYIYPIHSYEEETGRMLRLYKQPPVIYKHIIFNYYTFCWQGQCVDGSFVNITNENYLVDNSKNYDDSYYHVFTQTAEVSGYHNFSLFNRRKTIPTKLVKSLDSDSDFSENDSQQMDSYDKLNEKKCQFLDVLKETFIELVTTYREDRNRQRELDSEIRNRMNHHATELTSNQINNLINSNNEPFVSNFLDLNNPLTNRTDLTTNELNIDRVNVNLS